MAKLLLASTTAAAAMLMITGCGSADTSQEVTPVTQQQSSAPEPAATPVSDSGDIVAPITAAGGTCAAPAARGEQACTLNGIAFKLAIDGWEREAPARQQACADGWINENYRVLTNGVWTIATDHNADLEAIRSALANEGVTSETRPYCS